jgi:hypothetical protein
VIAGDRIANVVFDISPGLEVASDEDIDRIFARLKAESPEPGPADAPP